MWKALDDIRADGIAEGEARGRAEGEARGRAEGEARGEAKGLSKLGHLMSCLLRAGRTDDALSATEDEVARNRFFAEFGIA